MSDSIVLSPDAGEEYERQVLADKMELLYRQSFHAVFVSLFTALLLAIVLWGHMPQGYLFSWYGLIGVASLGRLTLFLRFRTVSPKGEQLLRWERPYAISLQFASLVWGVGSILLTYHLEQMYQFVVYFFLIGMAGGALSVYSSIRYMAITTISFILIPVTLWFLLQANVTQVVMGIGGLIFYISAFRATRILADTLHYSFLLTHELTVAKENAEWLSRIDSLTLLCNRRSFMEQANAQRKLCLRSELQYAVLVMDVDDFKQINDSHGHAAGDLALQQIARIIKKSVRRSDICGRLGGEEFAIFLPEVNSESALTVAEKVRKTIMGAPMYTLHGDVNITLSIGVSCGQETIEEHLRLADLAMYKAKHKGKNRIEMDS
jgi:diguanylate cyclase (GGDEF)-like protein